MIKVVDYFGLGDEQGTIEVAAEKLGIKDAEITVIHNDSLLDQTCGKDYVADGLLYKNEMPGSNYNLYIRKDGETPLRTVICHEMLHLEQYMSGDLSWDKNTRTFTWKGKKYPYSTPYKTRPWEQEVFRKQTQFLYEVRKAKGKTCPLLNLFKKKKQ